MNEKREEIPNKKTEGRKKKNPERKSEVRKV